MLSHGGAVSGFVAQNTVIPSTRSAVVLLLEYRLLADRRAQSAARAKLMPQRPDVPAIAGATGARGGEEVSHGARERAVDRATLGEDFSLFLSRKRSPPRARRSTRWVRSRTSASRRPASAVEWKSPRYCSTSAKRRRAG